MKENSPTISLNPNHITTGSIGQKRGKLKMRQRAKTRKLTFYFIEFKLAPKAVGIKMTERKTPYI